jgi:hypothetical protein
LEGKLNSWKKFGPVLPAFNRAKGHRIYDNNGNRFVDMYLDGGRAVCGWRREGVLTALKNEVSKGVFGAYPSVFEGRFLKAVKRLFEEVYQIKLDRVLLYESEKSFLEINGLVESDIVEGLDYKEKSSVLRWRPYSEASREALNSCSVFVAVLPLFFGSTVVVCVKDGATVRSDADVEVCLPAAVLNSAVKAVSVLTADLKECSGEAAVTADSGLFFSESVRCDGRYLFFSEKNYDSLVTAALKSNILLSPVSSVPSYLPETLSHGEYAKLKIFFEKNL